MVIVSLFIFETEKMRKKELLIQVYVFTFFLKDAFNFWSSIFERISKVDHEILERKTKRKAVVIFISILLRNILDSQVMI